jgi:hypothetical protein
MQLKGYDVVVGSRFLAIVSCSIIHSKIVANREVPYPDDVPSPVSGPDE